MPKWSEYKAEASGRGALAFELYIVESKPALPPEQMREILPAHLAYQAEQEKAGNLFLAGPLSDDSGEEMSGGGMIIYRAMSMDHARKLADADPMHAEGGRTYSLRKWLVNEGSLSVNLGLSTKGVSLG